MSSWAGQEKNQSIALAIRHTVPYNMCPGSDWVQVRAAAPYRTGFLRSRGRCAAPQQARHHPSGPIVLSSSSPSIPRYLIRILLSVATAQKKEGDVSIFWGLPLLGAQPIARNLRFAVGSLLSHMPEGEKKRFHLPRCPVLVMRILALLSDDIANSSDERQISYAMLG